MSRDIRPIEFWAAFDADGEIDMSRLCALKNDCRVSAKEKRDGWTVEKVVLATEKAFNSGRIY